MAEPGMAHMRNELRMVVRGETRTHRFLRSRILGLFLATLALDAVATLLMYMLEHDARGTGFHGIGGALFWVSAQPTTVSSQMPNPVTTGGRILDVGLEVWAISVVATLAGSISAFLHARRIEQHQAEQGANG